MVAAVEQEEWTTTKKIVNHKTRQTETRVQRQIVMEDGKVIADSGPQVSSKTKEDVTSEESESTNKKANGNKNSNPALAAGYIRVPGTTHVVNEKTETKTKTKSSKNENLQYHDEGLKELTGFEVHKKAICSPNDLISLREDLDPPTGPGGRSKPRGKLIHYSSSGKTVSDKEETKELSKKNYDGDSTTEITKTYHHEEIDDNELPEKDTIGMQIPESYSTTNRSCHYYKNYEDENDEDVIDRQNHQKKAIASVGRFHTDSGYGTRTWVGPPSPFGISGGASEDSGSSVGSDEIIRKVRTKAGGNVISIQMENQRSNRGSSASLNKIRDQPSGSSNSPSPVGIGSVEYNRRRQVIKESTEPSVLDLISSKYHTSSAGVGTRDDLRSDDEDDERSPDPPVDYYGTPTRNYPTQEFRTFRNSSQQVRSASRTSSINRDADSPAGVTRGPSGMANMSGRRSGTPSRSFYFGDETDASYHQNVRKEKVKDFGRVGTIEGEDDLTSSKKTSRNINNNILYHNFEY